MSALDSVFDRVTAVYNVRDKTGTTGSTTLTVDAAVGATTLTVAAITNFAVGDTIRVGSGETMELCHLHASTAPTGTTITLAEPLVYGHLSGQAVVEQTVWDMGDPTDAGVTIEWKGGNTDVFVATRRLVFATLPGYQSAELRCAWPTVSLHTLAACTGIDFAKITGDGLAADTALSLQTDGNEFGGATNQSWIVIGRTKDQNPIRAEMWGTDMDYTGVSFALATGQPTTVSMRAVAAAGGIVTTAAAAYTVTSTIRPTNLQVFTQLDAIGVFTDDTGAGNSTLASGPAAGASAITVASGHGADYDDNAWIRIGGGDTVEYHLIASISTDTITLATRLLRAFASGTAVVGQALTEFAAISQDGGSVQFGGGVDPINLGNRLMSAGLRQGNANVSAKFAALDLTLTRFAQALGIPAANIVNNRLPFREDLGTATINGVFMRGLTKGKVHWINIWGAQQDLSSIATTFASTGAIPNIPLAFKPSSGIQFVQYVA